MYKETITYTDFNGVERKEDFWFNLTKAELIKMELMTAGTFTDMIQRIINAKDTADIIKQINNLLLEAYGVKSEDGRFFHKSDEIRKNFENSEPYSIMFMKLVSDDEAAAKFINGIMPKDVLEAAAQENAKDAGMQVLMPAT